MRGPVGFLLLLRPRAAPPRLPGELPEAALGSTLAGWRSPGWVLSGRSFNQYLGFFFLILDLAFYTEVIMNFFQLLMKKKEVSF